MASNRFRYPPAPNNGGDTFSDSLVGNQFMGSQQMTLGNFYTQPSYNQPSTPEYNLGSFSNPITLNSLNMGDLVLAQKLTSNNLEVFVNNDMSEISSFVLYGSLKKRLAIATQNVVNFFPAAIFVDGVNVNYVSGNTTAYDILYDLSTEETTFKTSVNTLANPFSIEFTTNGNLLTGPISEEQIINNFTMFGLSADTLLNIADGTVSPIRNLTKEFKKYTLSFSGQVGEKEYKINGFKPQTTTNSYIVFTVNGNPFNAPETGGTMVTTSIKTFYIKPSQSQTEEELKNLGNVERFLLNRDVVPIYTSTFQVVKETTNGVKYYDKVKQTWPLEDNVNIDIDSDRYTNYLLKLANLGDEIDREKTNLISRFLTSPQLKEFDGTNQKIEKTLQIYGRSFDDIKTFVDGIAYMTNVSYDSKNNIPNELIKNFAKTLGWSTPSTLNNTTFLDSVLGVETPEYSGTSVSQTPAELDIELYRRILLNTAYLFKSKGTRKSIEFLLTLLGAPEALVEFNEYVVIAGAPINMNPGLKFEWTQTQTGEIAEYKKIQNKFDYQWQKISGGSYTTETLNYSLPFNQYYISTGTTFNPFVLPDYPIDSQGYPTTPRTTENYFFQRGAGWYEMTEEHKSDLVLNVSASTLTGCTPNAVSKFREFTWGGFWTMGQYSNSVNCPYLDRFRRFPHMSFGFGLTRVIDDKKSWVLKEGTQYRDYSFNNRDAFYQTQSEKLVLNVKNVDLTLNIGQGLTYDVWQQSAKYNCFFSGGTLPSPYPRPGGKWDSTNPKINAKNLDFKTFKNHFWKVFIDAKNRMTINDGKTGGYPTLQQIYLDYLNTNCGENNQYTYQKMIDYTLALGDYWIKIVEQMFPATTLWTSGVKVENSVFHRDKFVYRCFSVSGDPLQSVLTTTFTVSSSGFTGYPWPLFSNSARMMSMPTPPQPGTTYYNNLLSGTSTVPLSSYATSYNINNQGKTIGSALLSKETNKLANSFHTNKKQFTAKSLFTKKGSTDNLLYVKGLKELGFDDLSWLENYTITTPKNVQNSGGVSSSINTSRPSNPSVGTTRGGGGY